MWFSYKLSGLTGFGGILEIENVGNKFKVAILAAKRAKQIMKNGKKKIDMNASNPLTIALEEIKQGLVTNQTLIDDENNLFLKVEAKLNETENNETSETENIELVQNDDKNTVVVEQIEEEKSSENQKATAEEILKKNLTE